MDAWRCSTHHRERFRGWKLEDDEDNDDAGNTNFRALESNSTKYICPAFADPYLPPIFLQFNFSYT